MSLPSPLDGPEAPCPVAGCPAGHEAIAVAAGVAPVAAAVGSFGLNPGAVLGFDDPEASPLFDSDEGV